MTADGRFIEERILVVAPTGRDAPLICEVLSRAGFEAQPCQHMQAACAALADGAGALVIAEEALSGDSLCTLTDALRQQPPWSDIPLLVSSAGSETTESLVRAIAALDPSGNVTVLERPIRIFTLTVTVQAMLRARRHQYQLRDLFVQMEDQLERLQTERELRARFVSMLAHDLRGPVSAAMLGAELVLRCPEQLEQRRDLGTRIKRNLQRVEHMVRDLLDATRIQAGRALPLRVRECELVAIAQDIVEELNAASPGRLSVDAPARAEGVWSGEELRRALWNLASNALKYGSPDSPVTIRIRVEEQRCVVSVHNFGNPIAPKDQARIFEPFARTGAAENGTQLGWGLGLTLVRGCAEAHGGAVRVESAADSGTTFTLVLPLDAREAAGPRARQESSIPPPLEQLDHSAADESAYY